MEDNTSQKDNLRDGSHQPSLLDDNGFSGETGVELTPEFCARLGAAIGSLVKGGKVAVGCSHDKAAAVLKMALVSGILSVGGGVWDFGACIPPQFDYFAGFSRIGTGVYVAGGRQGMHPSAGGGGASRHPLHGTIGGIPAGHRQFQPGGLGGYAGGGQHGGYAPAIPAGADQYGAGGTGGLRAEVRGADYETVRMLSFVLSILGCEESGGHTPASGSGGRRLSIFDPEAGYIWPERVTAALCYMRLEDGGELALPYDAPLAVDELAARYGKRIHRYLNWSGGRLRR